MAITNFLGDRYTCLSSDVKPVVLDGAILTELDTGRDYYRYNGAWVLTTASQVASGFTNILREDFLTFTGIASGIQVGIPSARTYDTGRNRLQVGVNGIIQTRNSGWMDRDYQEITNTGVYFSYAIPSGAMINFTIWAKDSSVTT